MLVGKHFGGRNVGWEDDLWPNPKPKTARCWDAILVIQIVTMLDPLQCGFV